jgi:hypothetical protein
MNDKIQIDGNYDRQQVEVAVGILEAVLFREPSWDGCKAACQPIFDWSKAHPSHEPAK